MAKMKKVVSKAVGGKAKAPKKAMAKKAADKVIKKAAPKVQKKAVTKKRAVKKPVIIDSGFQGHGSASNPWGIPADVMNVVNAYYQDGGSAGLRFRAAVGKLSKKSSDEIMQSLDWQSKPGRDAIEIFQKKLKIDKTSVDRLLEGKIVKDIDSREFLEGKAFGTKGLSDRDIAKILDELMDRLIECCRCCRCWPCRPFGFCKVCFKHQCRVEVGPVGATYPHAHRIQFNGATVSASGTTATVDIAAAGGVPATQFVADTGAAGDTQGTKTPDTRFHTKRSVDTLLTNHKAAASVDHDNRYYTESEVDGMFVADSGAAADTQGTKKPDPRFYTKRSVDSLLTAHGTSAAHDGRYYTETEVDGMFVADTGAAGDTQGTQKPDPRFYTKRSVDSMLSGHASGAAHDGRYYTESEVDNMFVADTGAAGDVQGTQNPDERYYTKRYIAGNMKISNDELAPNVKSNPASGNPDPSLGFDITITFPDPVVANPIIMIWGYWLDNANGIHGIKKITLTASSSGNLLTANCMVQDLSSLPYDKGVMSGNWSSRKLYINYLAINA